MVMAQEWFDDPRAWDLPGWMVDDDRMTRDPEDPDGDGDDEIALAD